MMKNSLNFLVTLVLLFSYLNYAGAQNPVKDMIRRALEEKSFMKLGIDNIITNHNGVEQKINFRDSEYGESLVEDSSTGSESELFAAINPQDSSNIVVAVIHFSYNQVVDQPLVIAIYFTHDFGTTWNKSLFDGTLGEEELNIGGGDPVLVFDSEGNLHLTYLIISTTDFATFKSKEFVYHAVSVDGGETWEAEIYFESQLFNPFDFEGIDRFLDKQWMVADLTDSPYRGNVYMGFVDFFIGDTTSIDGSIKMEMDIINPSDTSFTYDPVIVTSDSFKFVQYASVDLDSKGNLYIGFVGSYDNEIFNFYNSVSKDGGKTFSEARLISEFYFPGFTKGSQGSTVIGINNRYFPSPYIVIDDSENAIKDRIYATWTSPGIDSIVQTESDIYFCYSDDGGEVWTEPFILNNDSLPNSDQFYSTIEVNSKGIPIVCFYDKRRDTTESHNTDYFITYSLDLDSLDFSLQYPLTKDPSDFSKIGNKTNGFGIGEYNKMVSTGSYAIPFWSDGRKNDGDVNVYMALVPLDGIDHTVGMQEIHLVSDKISINNVSPNPSNGNFTLSFNLKNSSQILFEIYNYNGLKVYSNNWGKTNTGIHLAEFDISKLSSGVYILMIKSEFGYSTRKIVVEK